MDNKNWSEVFILCSLKIWENLNKEDRYILNERKHALNKAFLFTPDNIARLKKVNDILQKAEEEVHTHSDRIRQMQMDWLKNNLIVDFEIEFSMELWSEKHAALHPEI